MDKRDMLEQLVNYYCDGNKAKFAAKIGVKPQAFSNWFTRNSFDAELIYTNCENVSADWLLSSGEGEMIRETRKSNLPEGDKEFYQQQITFLSEQLRAANEKNKMLEEELLNELREKKANVG